MGSNVPNTFQDAFDPWDHNVRDLKAATSLCPKARAALPENIKLPQKIEMDEIWGGERESEGKEGRIEKGPRWLERHYENSLDLAWGGYMALTTLIKTHQVIGVEGSKIKMLKENERKQKWTKIKRDLSKYWNVDNHLMHLLMTWESGWLKT